MRLLLDTHVFLWLLSGDKRLVASWRAAVADPANEVFLSVASMWEAVTKYQVGKLTLPGDPAVLIPDVRDKNGITDLPINEESVRVLARLPSIHRDPFDRIIVAQAIQHGLTLLTVDAQVQAYPVHLLPP